VGGGAKRVPVSIERGLLHRIDEYAKAKGMSRSQLIARGAEMVLRAS
jgi:metal-responsive CopG/Arc/MetJ family transcriptional regulator